MAAVRVTPSFVRVLYLSAGERRSAPFYVNIPSLVLVLDPTTGTEQSPTKLPLEMPPTREHWGMNGRSSTDATAVYPLSYARLILV